MNEIKVLIVEDDMELAQMYRLKFEKEWFQVKIADNWFTAVTLVTEFEPNAILLDIMMPSMDWFETLRVIRELAPSLDCKIIMFSNLNSKEDIEKCMSRWADAYLLKANTTPKEATEKIYELLNNTKPSATNLDSQAQLDSNTAEHAHTCPHCWKGINIIISK